MTSVVILQARTNSTRLPGKVLLPVNGVPMVVLAAKRAANTGRKVIVMTSSQSSDDGLVAVIQGAGLTCYRGDLDNVLNRAMGALVGYDDQTIVFRLTADNVFPDGQLLDEVEEEFLTGGFEYLCCNGMESGLPYGVSVEVTRLCHLREAAERSMDAYDQEHVTPYIARKFGTAYFKRYGDLGKGHYRCTVDSLDDYVGIQKVFSYVQDPIHESFLSLVGRLNNAPYQPVVSAPVHRLVLGTAQFGSKYGIANVTGRPSRADCKELVKTAIANGVIYLDTARAYAESEAMVGYSLGDGWVGRAKIITKLAPLQDCPVDAPDASVRAFVDASVFRSCSALGVRQLHVLMLHRAAHLTAWDGAAWKRLLDHQSEGVVQELGISVQNPEELVSALEVPEITHIQMPFNLLDWRWDPVMPEVLAAKSARKLVIHVRSALLQGLLLSTGKVHWQKANMENSSGVMDWLAMRVADFQRASVADLCLAYVNAMPWVDGIAIGVDNMDQLVENINYFSYAPLRADEVDIVRKTRPLLLEATLNPAFWRNN